MVDKRKAAERNLDDNTNCFAFRVKIGECEVEIKGKYEEVAKTMENLQSLIDKVHKAFEEAKPKTVATLTVRTEPSQKSTSEEPVHSYPKISSSTSSEDAVLRMLETDWGKWRPRTIEELKEAMKVNALKFSDHSLDEALKKLGDKGLIRRWNTNTGFVYILAETKRAGQGGQSR